MPLMSRSKTPTSFPSLQFLTLNGFKRGVITLIDKSNLPTDALQEANNLFLYENGQPGTRWGVGWFGTAPSSDTIDGFEFFDYNGAIHLVVAAGSNIYRSTDDGVTWSTCSGGTHTAGHVTNMHQNGGYLYITNGVDNIIRYDGTTTLSTYTALTTPSAPTSAKTGLGGTTISYFYKISAVNTVGFTVASTKVTQTVDRTRDAWDDSNYVTLTLPAYQSTQTRYDIYVSEDDLSYFYLDSVSTPTLIYRDNGTAVPIPSTLAPTDNTTQGELYEELCDVGSRMYGVRNVNHRYRIGFTGAGNYAGAFSSAYDGGYLDWQPGGKFIPVKVEDYRDGKGSPLATIWCKSADGQGCILQMSLDTVTIGNISITVPSAYRLPGSRGTSAPNSVVNVLNDYMFYNQQGFYNFGSRAQYLNLLSTDEASGNIRPTVRQISQSAESGIASIYFDAKVFFSIPLGSSTNNYTAVFDTERKAWLPKAFTIGFKKFLRYTDQSGAARLLCVKAGDTRLSEINANIQGDYGVPFETSLLTGLYPTCKNRFDFLWTEEANIELSNPQGVISAELIGIEREKGFSSTATATIDRTTLVNVGHGTFLHGTTAHGDTSVVIDTYSESSVKRYFPIEKELNAVEWGIRTNTLDAKYILRTLQTSGTPTQDDKPRSWRI